MKKLSKTDVWQIVGFVLLWIVHNRINSLFYGLVPSALDYALYMAGYMLASALYDSVWFLGLWFISIAMRRREIRPKTIGIALALALGLGCVSYYIRTPLLLLWGGTVLVFKSACPLLSPVNKKTKILFAAIILCSFAYGLLASHMDRQYGRYDLMSLLMGTPWLRSAVFLNRLSQCVIVFLLSRHLSPAEKTVKPPCFTAFLRCACGEQEPLTERAEALLAALNESAPLAMRLRPPKDRITVSDSAVFEGLKAFFEEQAENGSLLEEPPGQPYHTERNGEERIAWYAAKWYRCRQCGCLWEFWHSDSEEEGFLRKFPNGEYAPY